VRLTAELSNLVEPGRSPNSPTHPTIPHINSLISLCLDIVAARVRKEGFNDLRWLKTAHQSIKLMFNYIIEVVNVQQIPTIKTSPVPQPEIYQSDHHGVAEPADGTAQKDNPPYTSNYLPPYVTEEIEKSYVQFVPSSTRSPYNLPHIAEAEHDTAPIGGSSNSLSQNTNDNTIGPPPPNSSTLVEESTIENPVQLVTGLGWDEAYNNESGANNSNSQREPPVGPPATITSASEQGIVFSTAPSGLKRSRPASWLSQSSSNVDMMNDVDNHSREDLCALSTRGSVSSAAGLPTVTSGKANKAGVSRNLLNLEATVTKIGSLDARKRVGDMDEKLGTLASDSSFLKISRLIRFSCTEARHLPSMRKVIKNNTILKLNF
jgi:hypothetical protein